MKKLIISATICFAFLGTAFLSHPIAWAAEPGSSQDDGVAELPVVGLDANQQSIVRMIPVKSYQETLLTAFTSVQDSLIAVLADHEKARPADVAAKKPGWRIQTIGIGVGLGGQIGLGPIWRVTASPRIRLIFTRSNHPVYPD